MQNAESHALDNTLFAHGLPANVHYKHVASMFQHFAIQHIFLSDDRHYHSSPDWCQFRPACESTQTAEIVFLSVAEAEKALALLHLRIMPHIQPSVLLALSTIRRSHFSGLPRFVKRLPNSFTEAQLYELLRPFGCLAYVRIYKDFGPVVQFWNDADAKSAEGAVEKHFTGDLNIRLQAYDPYVLFCSNLNSDVDDKSLKNYFAQYSSIQSARMLRRRDGRNRALGLVMFSLSGEAFEARKALHRTVWRSKTISVAFHEPKSTVGKSVLESPAYTTPRNEDENSIDISMPIPPELDDPSERGSLDECQQNHDEEKVGNGSLCDGFESFSEIREQEQGHPSKIEEENDQVHMLEQQNMELERKLQDEKKRMLLFEERTTALLRLSEEERDVALIACETWRQRLLVTEEELAESEAEVTGLKDKARMLEHQTQELVRQLQDEKKRTELLEETTYFLRQAEKDRDLARDECEEWRRQFLIADSRRKILELEADRPLWEEAKRKREMKEREEANRAEEARRKAEVEESERRMREFLAEERRRELEEKRRKELEEKRRKEQEEIARKAREQEERDKLQNEQDRQEAWRRATESEQERCHKRDSRLWTRGSWTNKIALERFVLVSNEFEQLKFSESKPLTPRSIPWPVCDNPAHVSPEEVDWKMVEIFFSYVQSTYPVLEYNKLVERIHRQFHPDKWQSRRILDTVQDPDLRRSLELAGTRVTQAMTPLWRKSKGYDVSRD